MKRLKITFKMANGEKRVAIPMEVPEGSHGMTLELIEEVCKKSEEFLLFGAEELGTNREECKEGIATPEPLLDYINQVVRCPYCFHVKHGIDRKANKVEFCPHCRRSSGVRGVIVECPRCKNTNLTFMDGEPVKNGDPVMWECQCGRQWFVHPAVESA